jgi:hypothetical protein
VPSLEQSSCGTCSGTANGPKQFLAVGGGGRWRPDRTREQPLPVSVRTLQPSAPIHPQSLLHSTRLDCAAPKVEVAVLQLYNTVNKRLPGWQVRAKRRRSCRPGLARRQAMGGPCGVRARGSAGGARGAVRASSWPPRRHAAAGARCLPRAARRWMAICHACAAPHAVAGRERLIHPARRRPDRTPPAAMTSKRRCASTTWTAPAP